MTIGKAQQVLWSRPEEQFHRRNYVLKVIRYFKEATCKAYKYVRNLTREEAAEQLAQWLSNLTVSEVIVGKYDVVDKQAVWVWKSVPTVHSEEERSEFYRNWVPRGSDWRGWVLESRAMIEPEHRCWSVPNRKTFDRCLALWEDWSRAALMSRASYVAMVREMCVANGWDVVQCLKWAVCPSVGEFISTNTTVMPSNVTEGGDKP